MAKLCLENARVILGSKSLARQSILTDLGKQYNFKHEVASADIDERAIGDRANGDPISLVVTLAKKKASAIMLQRNWASDGKKTYLITCDQVVVNGGRILEKPTSNEEACDFLFNYSGASAKTVGSIVVCDVDRGRIVLGVESAEVHFKPIPAGAVYALVSQGQVMECAGALKVEDPLLSRYISYVEGQYDTIMGLSSALLLQLLMEVST